MTLPQLIKINHFSPDDPYLLGIKQHATTVLAVQGLDQGKAEHDCEDEERINGLHNVVESAAVAKRVVGMVLSRRENGVRLLHILRLTPIAATA